MDLPPPVNISAYRTHALSVYDGAAFLAEESMKRARIEVRDHYQDDVESGEVVDILLSVVMGPGKSKGFSSLYGEGFCNSP